MQQPSKVPTYNLKVVIRETGIKPDTLRAWERRYGLPEPDRTAGGHRLYSEYDIETIKWLSERQDEGLRINRAVALWREIEESGQDPLTSLPLAGTGSLPATADIQVGEKLSEFKAGWVDACLAFDEPRAEYILAQAFARYPVETVCLEVLRGGLSQIGNLWYAGEASAQQEHFASALAIRRLDALMTAAPMPNRNIRLLVACPAGENHIFSPLMISLFLRYRGYEVVYLGANVPLTQLKETVNETKPRLVIMSAQTLGSAASLNQAAQELYGTGVPVAYGGIIFNQNKSLQDRIPGYFLGESLESVVQNVESILSSKQPLPAPEKPDEAYQLALSHFRESQAELDAYVWKNICANGMKEYQLELANEFLGRDISAALSLGDMNYLEYEVEWIKMLLNNYNIPLELLPDYLNIYRAGLSEVLDENGKPIIDWMDQLAHSQDQAEQTEKITQE